MTVVEGLTRNGRTLRVEYDPSGCACPMGYDVEIVIDGSLVDVLHRSVYRGRMGRTYLTTGGMVRLPTNIGPEVLPPAILDGEPVAATIEEAERWHEVMRERFERVVANLRRMARAESGEVPAAPATGLGLPQITSPGRFSGVAIDLVRTPGALAEFARHWRDGKLIWDDPKPKPNGDHLGPHIAT